MSSNLAWDFSGWIGEYQSSGQLAALLVKPLPSAIICGCLHEYQVELLVKFDAPLEGMAAAFITELN